MKKTFDEIEVGKNYRMVNHLFDNLTRPVTCISDDFTLLNRRIKYFCFTDRISKVPSKEEFINALKDEVTTIPRDHTQEQYDEACRSLEIRRNTFAIWDYELKGLSASISIFREINKKL
jgi:hypothetical protein